MRKEQNPPRYDETAGCSCAAGPIFYQISDRQASNPTDISPLGWREEVKMWRHDLVVLLRWSRLYVKTRLRAKLQSPTSQDKTPYRRPI